MKKIFVILTAICLMMICSVGFAADEHKALSKQIQVAEKVMDAFDGEPVPVYSQLSSGFSATLKAKFDQKAFADIQKQVRIKLGDMKKAQFFAFQRYDQLDRIIYVTSFSKENVVNVVFDFDKENKLLNFTFSPVKQPAAK